MIGDDDKLYVTANVLGGVAATPIETLSAFQIWLEIFFNWGHTSVYSYVETERVLAYSVVSLFSTETTGGDGKTFPRHTHKKHSSLSLRVLYHTHIHHPYHSSLRTSIHIYHRSI